MHLLASFLGFSFCLFLPLFASFCQKEAKYFTMLLCASPPPLTVLFLTPICAGLVFQRLSFEKYASISKVEERGLLFPNLGPATRSVDKVLISWAALLSTTPTCKVCTKLQNLFGKSMEILKISTPDPADPNPEGTEKTLKYIGFFWCFLPPWLPGPTQQQPSQAAAHLCQGTP